MKQRRISFLDDDGDFLYESLVRNLEHPHQHRRPYLYTGSGKCQWEFSSIPHLRKWVWRRPRAHCGPTEATLNILCMNETQQSKVEWVAPRGINPRQSGVRPADALVAYLAETRPGLHNSSPLDVDWGINRLLKSLATASVRAQGQGRPRKPKSNGVGK